MISLEKRFKEKYFSHKVMLSFGGWVGFFSIIAVGQERRRFALSKREGKCKIKVDLIFRFPALQIIKICHLVPSSRFHWKKK